MNDKEAEKSSAVTVAVPLSLTDLATSLRTFVGLINDLIDLGAKGASSYRQFKLRKAATGLSQLYFSPNGMPKSLERLASGAGTVADVSELREALAGTAIEIDDAIQQLCQIEPLIREHFGMAAWERFQKLIDPTVGLKWHTRRELYRLVEKLQSRPDLSADEVVDDANRLLTEIAEVNNRLIRFHDEFLLSKKS